jgi:hypothetical protein
MPEVTRRTASETQAEGYIVQTQTPTATYVYEFDIVDEADGVVEAVARRKTDAEGGIAVLEPDHTESVAAALAELGYEIE